jgi:integrase
MKGHVRERGAGNWYTVIDIRDPQTGKRKRKWHSLPGCKGRRQAQNECAAIIAKLGRGEYVEANKATLAQFLERWLDQIQTQVSPRSYERYVEIVRKNLVPALGETQLRKLRPEHISTAYRNALVNGRRDGKGGLSPRTVIHMHRILKQALKQACLWHERANNPADLVKPPKVERKSMQTYDMTQTVALLKGLQHTRMFIPAVLGILCGLRRGEIAALRWSSVDLEAATLRVEESAEQMNNGAVRIKETKSGRARNVALSETVVEELRAWRLMQAQEFLRLGARPDDQTFVVTKIDGGSVRPRSLTQEWVRLIEQSGLPRIRLHDTRHSHATHMLQSNINPKIASERLGHSRVGITLDLYSHVMPGMQEDAVAKVDAALRAARKPS